MRRFGSALALSLVLVLGLAAVQAQEVQVGVTAAVNPAITGKPPISDKRALLVGTNVFHDELIVTEATGQAQMLFLDESALTIGPNSEVVLDEYVYDPEQKTGRLVLNATKGVFRLVGGRISKKTPVVLNTPTATIGIRGGISIISVAANGATDATFLFGQAMSVTSGGVTKQALRPGYTISVAAPDAAPSDPAPTTPETLNAALGSLEGSGAATDDEGVPQDEDVAASGVGELGSDNDPDAVAPGGAGSPGDAVAAAGATDKAEGTGDIDETSQLIVTEEIAGGITISGTLGGRIKHATNPLLGTDDTSPSFNLAFAGATVSNGIFDVEIASRFTAPIKAGSFTVTATEQPFGSGVLTGNGFLTSDQEFVIYELTDQGDGHKIVGWAGVPTTTFPTTGATFYNFRRDFVMDSDVPFVSKASGGSIISNLDTAEADAAIFWDTSGSSSALRPFGARFGGLSFLRDKPSARRGPLAQASLWPADAEVDTDAKLEPLIFRGFLLTCSYRPESLGRYELNQQRSDTGELRCST